MKRLIRDKQTLKQLFLYGMTGVALNLFGFVLYLTITWLGIEPKLAMTCLYSVGVVMSFFVNKHWVFGGDRAGYQVFFKFVMAHVVGYLMNFFLLYYFFNTLGFAHELVQFFAIFVVAFYLFVAFKFFVFNASSPNAVGVYK